MIEGYFQQLGFQEKEVKVYLSLAAVGKAGASVIAKRAGLRRSTTYSILEALVQRGVVSIEQDSGVAFYLPNPPDSFLHMLDRSEEELQRRRLTQRSAATELVTALQPLFKNEHYSVPKLQFFEGDANVLSMLHEFSGEWQASIEKYDFTWWGYQDVHFVESYRKWLDEYWSKMKPNEMIRLLSHASPTETKLRGKVPGREIRRLAPKVEFSSTIWVLGDYVVTIMTRQRPHYAFQLKDSVFAANQRRVFQLLWEHAKGNR